MQFLYLNKHVFISFIIIFKVKKYSTKHESFLALYGLSQDPDTYDYILVINNHTLLSGHEKIDYFIYEKQLRRYQYENTVIEWIPYNQFNEIKEIGKCDYISVYSAIWKDGPLYKHNISSTNYTRDSNKEVALRLLHINSSDPIDFLINEARKYSTNHNAFLALYGISQNPNTNDYILVQKNHTLISGNEKIDYFIHEMQLNIKVYSDTSYRYKYDDYDYKEPEPEYEDTIIEWIPYNQFDEIKETGKTGYMTVYSAIWKDGPLYKEYKWSGNYKRDLNKEIALYCLHIDDSQDSVDFLINEAKKYSANHGSFLALYGISQNPNTNDYILVLKHHIMTSGNEKIDYFINGRQLLNNKCEDIIIEWIPYSHFNKINETGKIGHVTIYSAIWKDGPLYKESKWSKNYKRDPNKKVALNCLHINNSQDPVDFLINEATKYSTKHESFLALYGLSQNPDTYDYILVINNHTLSSGNEKIDYFIYEKQLRRYQYENMVIEWIPYNQFNEIKEIDKCDYITVYSAIWKDGPLYKHNISSTNYYTRDSNKEVALRLLHINSSDPIDFLINEAKKYSTNHNAFLALYGISQNPNTNDYILVQKNYTLISGNEKIDYFIHEMQLNIKVYSNTAYEYEYDDYDYTEPEPEYDDTIIEWIPYNQFDEIKETGKIGYMTVYSAIWKDGPLYKEYKWSGNYIRDLNKEIALYCLHINDSQDSVDFLINEAKKYSTNHGSFLALYGISQNPNTNDYILVLKHHIMTSGNEKIDYFINERQLLKYKCEDIIIEWIPYNQFNEINETGKIGHVTIYSAIWKDGPLYKESKWSENYIRDPNKEVALNCLHINNSQDPVDFLINEAKKYLTIHEAFLSLYGISQNPNTYDYILVINNHTLICGNEKIDYFIYEKQLYIDKYEDTVIEWIPYNQFNEIKEIDKCDYLSIYSAIWKDGPLYKHYISSTNYYTRDSNKEVALRLLHINSSDPIDFLINEAKKYSTKRNAFLALYGISQNPNTNDYILVQKNYTLISGNEKIDYFIHEMQLNIKVYSDTSYRYKYDDYDYTEPEPEYDDTIIEWIPYNQLDEIKETGKIGYMTVYSAIWKDGPLYKERKWSENYTRDSNKKVALKCLHINDSQDPVDFLINEAKKYLTIHEAFLSLYGISQNPITNDYILVQKNYTLISGNEKIDYFIHEMQLIAHEYKDIVIEWIPYDQLYEIKEISKSNNHITIYSAIWKDGPLYKKNNRNKNFTRDSNKEVVLKCLHISNSQDHTDFLINEARNYSTKHNAFLALYGISQNPNTNDYILVQKNYILLSGNEKIDYFIREMQLKINEYEDIIIEWIPYNQFDEITEIEKNDHMTVYSTIWKDGPLYKERQWSENYTRDSNKEVVLRLLHDNLQDPIDFLINETKKYSTKYKSFLALYGISQHPNTNDYILVQNNYILTSGNEKIDGFIHEMQSKMDEYEDTVIEWIPYNQFDEIKEISKGDHNTAYSAIWKDGPLYKEGLSGNYRRNSNEEVALNCLHINNSQDPIDFLINEAKKYSTKYEALLTLYGISQNPNTNDYILVQSNDTLANVNEIIDDFIQQMHQ
ncbi:hypothetical protein RclHR1_06030001 [Rhizophagus clarus]|uniref:Protein kinase domain-containing protein n=1 Tax=Rhizophagus clarus TaxID=94130 RepID=A0A2Z6RS69_9GLOM|nr:hypothetical protein RclHR1_06030001 [Rhizophagus clarus]